MTCPGSLAHSRPSPLPPCALRWDSGSEQDSSDECETTAPHFAQKRAHSAHGAVVDAASALHVSKRTPGQACSKCLRGPLPLRNPKPETRNWKPEPRGTETAARATLGTGEHARVGRTRKSKSKDGVPLSRLYKYHRVQQPTRFVFVCAHQDNVCILVQDASAASRIVCKLLLNLCVLAQSCTQARKLRSTLGRKIVLPVHEFATWP